MGLGKTIQSIAYFAWLADELQLDGPHLVVCPLSVVNGWMNEFKRWLPKTKVLLFHGPRAELEDIYHDPGWVEDYDCVVTTFETCLHHINALCGVFWQSMIVDEAHKLKNCGTLIYSAMRKITTVHTIFLTGTPIQNNLEELRALLNFLFMDTELFANSVEIFSRAY